MSNKGELIKSTDLSSYLTADTVMDALDIETLKEVLGVGSSGGAKIVGGGSGTSTSTSMSINLSTTDWDFIEILSYPNSHSSGSFSADMSSVHTYIHKAQTSGSVPIAVMSYYNGSSSSSYYTRSINVSFSFSGTTLTLSGLNFNSTSIRDCTTVNVICYKY